MSGDGEPPADGLPQKIVRAIITVPVILDIPGAIGAVIAGAEGIGAALLSAIFVLIVGAASGWKLALLSVPLLAGAAVLGAVWAGQPRGWRSWPASPSPRASEQLGASSYRSQSQPSWRQRQYRWTLLRVGHRWWSGSSPRSTSWGS